jgi:hypothetical protein
MHVSPVQCLGDVGGGEVTAYRRYTSAGQLESARAKMCGEQSLIKGILKGRIDYGRDMLVQYEGTVIVNGNKQ